jgi:hypothetical protein
VRLFYYIVIPMTLTVFALLIMTDVYRRLRNVGRKPEEATS